MDEPGNPDTLEQYNFFYTFPLGLPFLPTWHYCSEDGTCRGSRTV